MTLTSRKPTVVVDASLIAMLILPERLSPRAFTLIRWWLRAETRQVAPTFMLAEVTNAIYKAVRRGEISVEDAVANVELVVDFGIDLIEDPLLHADAIVAAHRLGRPSTYDAHYLALAKQLECEIWTGDERLYNAFREFVPEIRWIGTFHPEPRL